MHVKVDDKDYSVEEFESFILKVIKTENIFDDTVDPKLRSEIESAALEHVATYLDHDDSTLDEKFSYILPFLSESKRLGLLRNISQVDGHNKIDRLLASTTKKLIDNVSAKPEYWVTINKVLTYTTCIVKDYLIESGMNTFLAQHALPSIKKSLDELKKLPIEKRRSVIDMHINSSEIASE